MLLYNLHDRTLNDLCMLIFSRKNFIMKIYYKLKLKNTIVFQVTFKLFVNFRGNMISLYMPFFRISCQQKMLKSWRFLSFHNINFNFSEAKVCWNKQNTLHTQIRIWQLGVFWSINIAKSHYHSSCDSHNI